MFEIRNSPQVLRASGVKLCDKIKEKQRLMIKSREEEKERKRRSREEARRWKEKWRGCYWYEISIPFIYLFIYSISCRILKMPLPYSLFFFTSPILSKKAALHKFTLEIGYHPLLLPYHLLLSHNHMLALLM